MSAQRNASVRRNKAAFGTMMSAKQPAFKGSFSHSKSIKKQPPEDIASKEKNKEAVASPNSVAPIHDLPLRLSMPIHGLPDKPDVTMAGDFDFTQTALSDIKADNLPKKPKNPYLTAKSTPSWKKKPSAPGKKQPPPPDAGSVKRKFDDMVDPGGWAGGWGAVDSDADHTDDDEETKQARAIERNKNRRGGGRGRYPLPQKPDFEPAASTAHTSVAKQDPPVKTPRDIVEALPLKTAMDLVTDSLIAKMNEELPKVEQTAPRVIHKLPPRPVMMAKWKKGHGPRSFF